MNSIPRSALFVAILFLFASCGEPERVRPVAITAHPARAGAEFDAVGKVSLYPGESCASQIMFIFHPVRSASISMAAPFKQSKTLTYAAHDDRTVHVWGKWRSGRTPGCTYVEATGVELQKSFW
jgi:hypothetical protein